MKTNLYLAARLSFAWLLAVAGNPLYGATHVVKIQNSEFAPATLTVKAGDTVTWNQLDSIQHTVTSGHPGAPDGLWDSGSLSQGQNFSHTFAAVGTFPYYCRLHSFMTGSIKVEAAQAAPPDVTITSPTNNFTLAAPGNVTIEAAASATGGAISQVEFFDGTVFLGLVNASPFKATVSLAAGTHSITAKATDSNGASAVSAAVTVIVNGGGTKIDDPIPQKIPKGDAVVELQLVLEGLIAPLGMAVPDDGSGRFLVYDQAGLVYVVRNGAKLNDPLVDVRSRLVALGTNYDERGLLGLATHPNFAQKPFIYTYTSEPLGPMPDFMNPLPHADNNHQSVIAEWRVDPANPDRIDPASRREILRVDKPQGNHNGGTLRFGADGFLYFSIGDGGAADDQTSGHVVGGNGQDKGVILGKVIRIDVDTRNSANGQYGIPPSNPFVGQPGVVQEIYAYGFRNPYAFSFDRQTGELYLGDVGQNQVEEADRVESGRNYGWPIKEGSFFFDPNGFNAGFVTTQPVRPVPSDLVDPFAQYDHDEGEAIIGGYVYRGGQIPALFGRYVTGDYGMAPNSLGRLFYYDGTQLKELRIGADDRKLGLWLKGFGEDDRGEIYVFASTNSGPSATGGKMLKLVSTEPPLPRKNSYLLTNLVSDIAGRAAVTDTNLVNPWGIATSATSPFWIADNGTGLSSLYNGAGAVQALVVKIATPAGAEESASPTGVIFNGTTDFEIAAGTPARFIFVTEEGTIVGWSSGTNSVVKVDNSATKAVYKGVTMAKRTGSNYLYAANFSAGKIDIFDAAFRPLITLGAFTDINLPPAFAPFNIQYLGGKFYVAYARQDDDKEDDVAGPGNGLIDIFDIDGNFVKRLATRGSLNSPWGMVMAPASFGRFGGALLVGNFGDGRVNAFDPDSGEYFGQLNDASATPITIEGLWDLKFGNGAQGGDVDKLYFTAGISGGQAIETHGLFGSIAAVSTFTILEIKQNGNTVTIRWDGGTPPYRLQKKNSLSDANWTDVRIVPAAQATVTLDGSAGFFRVQDQGTAQ